jgi:hypothetical protein
VLGWRRCVGLFQYTVDVAQSGIGGDVSGKLIETLTYFSCRSEFDSPFFFFWFCSVQYAPKDMQPDSLCDAPGSVCDAAYGFSIGRGSFQWTKGGWTTVRQCVTLNTPSEQDGSFTLDVNGARVINRDDIYYRSALPPVPDSDPESGLGQQEFLHNPQPPTGRMKPDSGGLLGPLLGTLLRRWFTVGGHGEMASLDPVIVASHDQQDLEWVIGLVTSTKDSEPMLDPTSVAFAQQSLAPVVKDSEEGCSIGFIGLFFRYALALRWFFFSPIHEYM